MNLNILPAGKRNDNIELRNKTLKKNVKLYGSYNYYYIQI